MLLYKRQLRTYGGLSKPLLGVELRRSENFALGVPRPDRLDRDATLLLQVDAESAQDRHRAAPNRDGGADLLKLMGRLENLDGRGT
jgi:hypothetical protein